MFLYAIASAYIGRKHNYTTNPEVYKEFANENFIYNDLKFPMAVNDIIKFEKKCSLKGIYKCFIYRN